MFMFRLAAASNHAATAYTSVLAVMVSSLVMSVTGGGLKPYERRAIEAAFASVSGDDARAQALLAVYDPIPERMRAVHLIPSQTIIAQSSIDLDMALLGGDLLGEPGPHARITQVAQAVAAPIEECLQACLTGAVSEAAQGAVGEMQTAATEAVTDAAISAAAEL